MSTIENMVRLALPNKKLAFYEVISGGCANLNIKFCCTNSSAPLILRIYLRDNDAAYREQFAFSGSTLCDVSNMLRYAHHMPPEYETALLYGLQSGGVRLPENWRISIFLLNLLSLLDCLIHCPPEQRPNQCADICELISFIIQHLDNCHEL